MPKNAVVTLLTSYDFLPGVQVLAHSIRRLRKRLQAALVLVITPDLVQHEALHTLGYDEIIVVDSIPNPNESHVQSWMQCGFTKLRIWQLYEFGYDRVLYIDADCAVVNPDFDLDSEFARLDHVDFAAAPDFFPPDCFNAGVMLIRTNAATFSSLLRCASDIDSYDGGDTGYLNQMFPDWYRTSHPAARLPFGFNAQRAMRNFTRRAPAYWHYVPINILHYSSNPKPWQRSLQRYDSFDFDSHSDPDEIFAKLLSEAELQTYPKSSIRNGSVSDHMMGSFVSSLPTKFPSPPANIKFGRYDDRDKQWMGKFASVYNLIDCHEAKDQSSIPFIIHQIWLGDLPIPHRFHKWIDSLRQLHPNFEYKLWRDEDVVNLNLIRRDLYLQANTPVERSDILRWELLYQFGGVYADLDIECVSPLENLLRPFMFVIGLGNTGCVELLNSFIAAAPRHPLSLACLHGLRLNDRLGVMKSTGPGAITRVIGNTDASRLIGDRVGIMPTCVLYPLPNRMRFLSSPRDIQHFIDRDHTFVIHHWSCSWQNNNSEYERGDVVVSKLRQHLVRQDLDSVCSTIIKFL